jgi:heme-degrading monooxygenase HmoA
MPAEAATRGVLEHALLEVVDGQQAAFEAAFAQAQSIIAGMDGYRWHRLERCVEHPHRYLLLVQWDSLAAHVEGFRNSPPYQQWKALLHHFYDPFPTVLHFETVYASAPHRDG